MYKYIYSFLVCLGVHIIIYGQSVVTKLTRAEIASQILLLASGEVGKTELTGRNDGKHIDKYRAVVSPTLNKKKSLDPYCGFFVYWCFYEYGLRPKPSVPGRAASWFEDVSKNKKIVLRGNTRRSDKIMPGMCVGYRFYKNRISHVGFIEKWDDDEDYCITIEANTSAANIVGVVVREGDGVYRKKRPKRMVAVVSDWVPPN